MSSILAGLVPEIQFEGVPVISWKASCRNTGVTPPTRPGWPRYKVGIQQSREGKQSVVPALTPGCNDEVFLDAIALGVQLIVPNYFGIGQSDGFKSFA